MILTLFASCEEIEPEFLQTNFLDSENNGNIPQNLSPEVYDGIPESNYTLLVQDNFEYNSYEWLTGSGENFEAEINDMKYKIKTNEYPFIFISDLITFDENKNYEIEMIIDEYKSSYWDNTAVCGITIGLDYSTSKCLYFIITADKTYYAGHYNDGWNNWHDEEYSDDIVAEGYNKVTIRKYNNNFYFFANETLLKKYDTKSFYGIDLGILINANNQAKINSLKISYID